MGGWGVGERWRPGHSPGWSGGGSTHRRSVRSMMEAFCMATCLLRAKPPLESQEPEHGKRRTGRACSPRGPKFQVAGSESLPPNMT